MRLPAARWPIVSLLALVLLGGCGQGNRSAVSGKVTLDGIALEKGLISFIPIEGTQGPTAGVEITNGSYAISGSKAPIPGIYRVEIRSQRKTGKKIRAGSPAPPNTMVDETVEAVPARYNKSSTLREELKAGSNMCDFTLTTK